MPAKLRIVEKTANRRVLLTEVPNKYYPGTTIDKRTVQVKCCGVWLTCDGFTNTCSCGKDYNFSGDLLAPREQWGEETGEHWTDIIRIR